MRVLRAKAHITQNHRSKLQAEIDGGSREQGWLLTGLHDPCQRQRFGAPTHLFLAVSGYINTVSDIQKAAHLDNTLTPENVKEHRGDAPKAGGRRGGKKGAKKKGE